MRGASTFSTRVFKESEVDPERNSVTDNGKVGHKKVIKMRTHVVMLARLKSPIACECVQKAAKKRLAKGCHLHDFWIFLAVVKLPRVTLPKKDPCCWTPLSRCAVPSRAEVGRGA